MARRQSTLGRGLDAAALKQATLYTDDDAWDDEQLEKPIKESVGAKFRRASLKAADQGFRRQSNAFHLRAGIESLGAAAKLSGVAEVAASTDREARI
eukprot:6690235-Prymnesium_polylepis.1